MPQGTSGIFKIRFWDEKYDEKKNEKNDCLIDVRPIIGKFIESEHNKSQKFEYNSANDEIHLIFDAPARIEDFVSTSKCLLEEIKRIAANPE